MSFPICSICKDEYSDENGNRVPKNLSCGHTVCIACAEKLVENCIIKCPMCRGETKVEKNDVKTLQMSFGLLEVIDTVKYSMNKKEKEIAINSPPWCKAHSYNLAEFVCINENCKSENKLMCRTCADFGEHKGHEKGLLQEESNKRRETIQDVGKKISSKAEKTEATIEKMKTMKSAYIENEYKKKVKLIDTHFEMIHRIVDERKKEVLETLRKIDRENIESLDLASLHLKEDMELFKEKRAVLKKVQDASNADLFANKLKFDMVMVKKKDDSGFYDLWLDYYRENLSYMTTINIDLPKFGFDDSVSPPI